MPTLAPEKPDQDRYNPGDLHAAEQFPNAYTGSDSDVDSRTKNNPDDTPTSNIDAAKEQEQNPMNYTGEGGEAKRKKSVKGFWRRYTPTALFGGGTVAGAIIMGSLGLSSLGFASISSIFTNDTNDANPSVQRAHIENLGGKLGGDVQKKLSWCGAVGNIRCQFNSLPEEAVEEYKKAGFSFGEETKTSNGRVVFTSITVPPELGGETARNVREFKRLSSNQGIAKRLSDTYDATRAIFFGGHFRNVLGDLGLTKLKKISGDTHEAAQESFRTAVETGEGVDTDTRADKEDPDSAGDETERENIELANEAGDETASAINEAVQRGEKIQSLSLKASNNPALATAQLMCTSYNTASLISTGAYAVKVLRYAAFAMAILTGISAMIVSESTPAEAAVVLGVLFPSVYPEKVENPATGQMIDNPNIGKNATDSEAYRVAAYGDDINLSDLAKRFFLSGGILGALQTAISWIDTHIGRDAVRTTCKLSNNAIVNVVSFLAAPVASAVLLGITQILPIEEWAASIVNNLIEAAAGANITTDIIGVDAGNLIFIGTALIMGTSAMQFGLKPGALASIRENVAANQKMQEDEIAWKREQTSPFDMTNQYSFLGQLAQKLQQYTSYEGSFAAFTSNLFSMLPGSLKSISSTASASFTQPVSNYPDSRFEQCNDPYFEEMGISPDMFCVPRFVPFDKTAGQEETLTYMESIDQMDENGDPREGTQYAKWQKYCNTRTERFGATSVPIEEQEDGIDWYTGKKCLEDTKQNRMFSDFTKYKTENATLNEVIKLMPDSAALRYDSISDAIAAAYTYHTTNTFIAANGVTYAR